MAQMHHSAKARNSSARFVPPSALSKLSILLQTRFQEFLISITHKRTTFPVWKLEQQFSIPGVIATSPFPAQL